MATYRIVGLDSTPLLYPQSWETQGDSVDMAPFAPFAGVRFTLSTCRYGPEGTRFLTNNRMTLLAECAGNTFLQVGTLELDGSLRDAMENMVARGLGKLDEYHDHRRASEHGRLNPAWRQSMEDFDQALDDRLGVMDGQTHRVLQAGNQEIHADPKIDRQWIRSLAGEQLAVHYAQRPAPHSLASRMLEQSASPAPVLMDAAAHHLALQEIPFVAAKLYKVSGEMERVAGARVDDRYQILFDFAPAVFANRQQNGFTELARQAYWQMHLGFARASAA